MNPITYEPDPAEAGEELKVTVGAGNATWPLGVTVTFDLAGGGTHAIEMSFNPAGTQKINVPDNAIGGTISNNGGHADVPITF